MARISFTPQLRRFTTTPAIDSSATTPRGALEDAVAHAAGLVRRRTVTGARAWAATRTRDGGNRGQTESLNLPPIAAVRFG